MGNSGKTASTGGQGSGMERDVISLSDLRDGQVIVCGDSGNIRIAASLRRLSSCTQLAEYHFFAAEPQRFSISYAIPDNTVNACITLNDKMLSGLFSEDVPEGAVLPECVSLQSKLSEEHHHPVTSTIHPGETQIISFKWLDQDVLRFYLIGKDSRE